MARPFGRSDNSEGKQEKDGKKDVESRSTNLSVRSKEKRAENSSDYCDKNQTSDQKEPDCTDATSHPHHLGYKSRDDAAVATNFYCISDSNNLNCGPTFPNVIKDGKKTYDSLSSSSTDKCETDRRIKVRKGIFTSKRIIDTEDIQIVAEVVEEDWKKLLKKLPGVTLNNLRFHQEFINAMDRGDSTNMAEIALCTWKKELPEFSTIGNLSEILFSIGHPDIVTCLRP